MAGLLKDEFVSEVMTELSWIMRVIDDLCEKTGLETYESTLIKYRVQPEEAHAIEKFFGSHLQEIDALPLAEIRQKVAADFYETTGKPWHLADEILEKLLTRLNVAYGIEDIHETIERLKKDN